MSDWNVSRVLFLPRKLLFCLNINGLLGNRRFDVGLQLLRTSPKKNPVTDVSVIVRTL